MALAMQIETPAGTFASFEEAAAAGYPVACQAFALCVREATVAIEHPVLGAYPSCAKCAERLA